MITSIVVNENKILISVPSFLDNMVRGTPGAWISNTERFQTLAIGGFWDAGFTIEAGANLERIENYLLYGLNRSVCFYNHFGILVWEGFIFSMTMTVGGSSFEVSLKSMANRVWVRYNAGQDGETLRSTKKNDTSSQARWGIKEKVVGGANIGTLAQADAKAQSILDITKDPNRVEASLAIGNLAAGARLDITCHGYFRTLEWRTYAQITSHDTLDSDGQIQAIVDDAGQFIAGTDLTDNPTQVTQEYDNDITAAQAILNITSNGNEDNSKRYLVGVREGRILRYEQEREPR